MRRHINRYSPREVLVDDEGREIEFPYSRRRMFIDNRPKRGPKDRRPLWPTLKYTIEKGIGVVWQT